jgi:hypothetical protein
MLIEGDWLGATRVVVWLALHPEIVVVICNQFGRLLAGKTVAERPNLYGFNVRVTAGLFAFLSDEDLNLHLIRRSESPIEEGSMRFLIWQTRWIRGDVKLVPIVDRERDGAIILNGCVRTPLQQQTQKNDASTLRRYRMVHHITPPKVVLFESMWRENDRNGFRGGNYSLGTTNGSFRAVSSRLPANSRRHL